MGWTKRQFIQQAYEEIGYASYAYDLEPEQLESAMKKMDAMMATWATSKGIRVGYPMPDSPEGSDLDEETSVIDAAKEAIYTNLAIRLAPPLGKQVSAETKRAAKDGYNGLLSLAAMPKEQQFPKTLPRGAGNKPHSIGSPFIDSPEDRINTGPDNALEFD